MASRTVTVGSTGGLHTRPAALVVAAAQALPVAVTIRANDGPAVAATSMLSVLTLRASFGTEVTLEAEGDGAESALDQLAALITRSRLARDTLVQRRGACRAGANRIHHPPV